MGKGWFGDPVGHRKAAEARKRKGRTGRKGGTAQRTADDATKDNYDMEEYDEMIVE